jgi:curved DNA-binding protein CbpA
VTPDYYATLGLSPASEDVVIRAAYLALIRRYHPDGNTSAAASARTRAINAAYAVLSDPDKRAEYDQKRAAEAWPNMPVRRRRRTVPSGLFAAASVTLLLLLVFLVAWLPLPVREPPDRTAQAPSRATNNMEEPLATPVQDPLPAVAPPATDDEMAQPPLQLDEPPPTPPRLLAAPNARVAPQPRTAQLKVARSAPSQLANLDRQQTLLYNQSWVRADAAKRAQLLTTRDRFIARRDGCRSNSCVTAAYLARMREVSEIMIGKSPPPR